MIYIVMRNEYALLSLSEQSAAYWQWAKEKTLESHKHVSKALQTGVAVGAICYHTYTKRPHKARSAFIRVASNSAWFAHQIENFPILSKIDSEKFILGLSIVGMALSSPQLYDALMSGNYISKALTMTAIAAFGIRMVPPIEKLFTHVSKKGWEKVLSTKLSDFEPVIWANEKFNSVNKSIDHFVYHNKLSSNFFKHAPSVLLGANALAQSVYALITRDWPSFATALASLVGTGLMVAAEFGMKAKQELPEPTIFDSIEPIEQEIEPVSQEEILEPENVGPNILILTEDRRVVPVSAMAFTA